MKHIITRPLLLFSLKLIWLNIHVCIFMHCFMSVEVLSGFLVLLTKNEKNKIKNQGAQTGMKMQTCNGGFRVL